MDNKLHKILTRSDFLTSSEKGVSLSLLLFLSFFLCCSSSPDSLSPLTHKFWCDQTLNRFIFYGFLCCSSSFIRSHDIFCIEIFRTVRKGKSVYMRRMGMKRRRREEKIDFIHTSLRLIEPLADRIATLAWCLLVENGAHRRVCLCVDQESWDGELPENTYINSSFIMVEQKWTRPLPLAFSIRNWMPAHKYQANA